jgi:hypothetical protein
MKTEIEEMEEEIMRLNGEIRLLTLDLRYCLNRERRNFGR